MLLGIGFIFFCFFLTEARSPKQKFDLNPEKLIQQAEALARQFRNLSKGEINSVKKMQQLVVNFTAPVEERVQSVEEMLKKADPNHASDAHVAAILIVDIIENTRRELRTMGAEAELFLQVLIKTFLVSLDEDFVHADEKEKKEMVLAIIKESRKHPEHY